MNKTSISFNMRNSNFEKSKFCFKYLTTNMNRPEYHLTALNLKFCFLSFDREVKPLADALRTNKSLVKLDLSNNALTWRVVNYLIEAL